MENNQEQNIWPLELNFNGPNFEAPFIEANALVFLWQSFDNEQYYKYQANLVKWGLENNLIKEENGVFVQTSPINE